jgi:hypothetical protein
MVAVDFSRLFYHYTVITNCARNGALYGSNPLSASESPYASLQDAALADAGDLNPQPTVNSTTGTDADNHPYVEVTVTYPFTTFSNYLGSYSTVTLARTVRMRVGPS